VSVELAIAVGSAVVSLISVVISGISSYRVVLLQERIQGKREFQRYSEPLLRSADSLQSRLANIVDGDFLTAYLQVDDASRQRYAKDNTAYVVAEFLCWMEIARRDQRFVDMGGVRANRRLFECLGRIASTLARDDLPKLFCLFRGEQRAIGEIMIAAPVQADGNLREPLGYAAFCERLDEDPRFASWLNRLRDDVNDIHADEPDNQRLVRLQHDLVDLIEILDPKQQRLRRRPRRLPGRPSQSRHA
jgi:hypothetical protein